MMAAYQPTPGGVHPGLAHGHPGMPQNAGPHMGQPMQMHPGMSGAPHVSQPGAMVGMQPGAQGMGGQHPGGMPMQQMGGQSLAGGMPNAQAMSHMTSQQAMQQQIHAAQSKCQPMLRYTGPSAYYGSSACVDRQDAVEAEHCLFTFTHSKHPGLK